MHLLNYKTLIEVGVLAIYFSAIIATICSASIFMLYAIRKSFGHPAAVPAFETLVGTPAVLWIIYLLIC